MERILAGFAITLLFCFLTGIAYLRMPPEPRAHAPLQGAVVSAKYSGQRHAAISPKQENEVAAAIAATH